MRTKIYKDVMTCIQKRLIEEYLKEGLIVKGSLKEYKEKNNYEGDIIIYGSINYVNLKVQKIREIQNSEEYSFCNSCMKNGGSSPSGVSGFYNSRCAKKCLLNK